MFTENNKKIVRHMTEQSWNRGNVDVLDEVCLPTYRLQGVASVEQLKQEIAAYRCAFPDLHITIEELIAEGDAVVSRWSLYGTHLGLFEDIAPTGKPVAASGISIFHFVDGKIVEDYVESSSPGPRQQLLDTE